MDPVTFLHLPLSPRSPPPSSSSSPFSTPPTPPPPPPPPRSPSISYGFTIGNVPSAQIGDDACSCLVILLTFCFFASMTLILGFYGSVNLVLGPNCSRILQANPWFVSDIRVRAEVESVLAPTLYGFITPPPLDVLAVWSETRNISVPPNFHQEWIFNLNKGEIQIFYDVKSQGAYPLILAIAQGKENLLQWIEQPSHPNTTLSWSLMHGTGKIQQTIEKQSDYYVAVGNLNNIEVKVELVFNVRAVMYNTTGAYYNCSVDHGPTCSLKLSLQDDNVAVLTTQTPEPTTQIDEWYVKLSYGPRWITYFAGSGLITVIIFMAFQIFSSMQYNYDTAHQTTEVTSERRSLLSNKDDDNQSLGSSYESVSHDEEDNDGHCKAEVDMPKDGENKNSQDLCTICCDARRDCFFLPCGHCAVCFTCGTRILDEAGTCPICRRKMKKVRKIFKV